MPTTYTCESSGCQHCPACFRKEAITLESLYFTLD